MPVSLDFDTSHHYAETADSINIPISPSIGRQSIQFSALVCFAQDPAFSRNFLGGSGWLDRLRIAVIDYDRALYVSSYQS